MRVYVHITYETLAQCCVSSFSITVVGTICSYQHDDIARRRPSPISLKHFATTTCAARVTLVSLCMVAKRSLELLRAATASWKLASHHVPWNLVSSQSDDDVRTKVGRPPRRSEKTCRDLLSDYPQKTRTPRTQSTAGASRTVTMGERSRAAEQANNLQWS